MELELATMRDIAEELSRRESPLPWTFAYIDESSYLSMYKHGLPEHIDYFARQLFRLANGHEIDEDDDE